ncbi:MAG: ATP-grasp domain-containing protein [Methanothrix sp.]|nr:MAG: ATP-grasp domain-containing protein [Methanothrix sp.]
MKILVAEYASAVGLGGTCELEGRAMLSTLAGSFERAGHDVVYPTSGPVIEVGKPLFLQRPEDFERAIGTTKADAGLVIAPDGMQPHFLEILEENTVNLGNSPAVARLCADKLLCTARLKESGVPVADIVPGPEPCEKGCHRYVIKPRTGCGSEGVRVTSSARAPEGFIATRYVEGLHLSASFIVGRKGEFLPLTINRQLIDFHGDGMAYNGSQVPYNTPRAAEIWDAARKAAAALGLRGYAGIDFVVGDLPRAVDVNARPTTSIIGIVRVMKEEIGELMVRARFGGMPESVKIEGEFKFQKSDLL